MIKAVTFDCAETLVKVDWRPDSFAVACAEVAGVSLPNEAKAVYLDLYLAELGAFRAANLTRDPAALDAFYRKLCCRWLAEVGADTTHTDKILHAAERLAYSAESILFESFPETVAALESVRARGLKIGVLSNWDLTLHRVLEIYGIGPLLDFALASLEEGIEKPQPEFFDLARDRLGVLPEEILHVGDSLTDDFEGAIGCGWHACLIDRSQASDLPHRICELTQVLEVLDWIA